SHSRSAGRGTSRMGEPPSRNFEVFNSSDGNLRVEYPSNWEAFSADNSSVTFAPSWAMHGGELTRGVIVGFMRSRRDNDLNVAMDDLLASLRQSNAYLREDRRGRYQESLDGQRALATYLVGRNTSGDIERVWCVISARPDRVVYV